MIPVPCFVEIEKQSAAAIAEIPVCSLICPAMRTGDKFLLPGLDHNVIIVSRSLFFFFHDYLPLCNIIIKNFLDTVL